MKKPEVIDDGRVLVKNWSPEALREVWEFAQHDWDRFIRLLVYIDEIE